MDEFYVFIGHLSVLSLYLGFFSVDALLFILLWDRIRRVDPERVNFNRIVFLLSFFAFAGSSVLIYGLSSSLFAGEIEGGFSWIACLNISFLGAMFLGILLKYFKALRLRSGQAPRQSSGQALRLRLKHVHQKIEQ